MLEDSELPCAGPLQQLVQTWKELRRREREEYERKTKEEHPPWRPFHRG